MRIRAVIHVGGPPESGKTSLVEAMLRSLDAWTLAARCLRDTYRPKTQFGLLTWDLAPPSPIVPILGECWTGDRPSLQAPLPCQHRDPNDGCGITHHSDNRPATYFAYYTY